MATIISIHLINHIFQPIITILIKHYLVGGVPTPLKNMSSSMGVTIPNIWKNKKSCSKPPTSPVVDNHY